MTSPSEKSSGRTLKTVTTAFQIVEELKLTGGSTITELADRLNLSKSAIFHHLNTLHENQYVIEEGNKYRLSYQFLLHGEYVRTQSQVYQAAKEHLDGLAEETDEYVQLVTEEFGKGVTLYKTSGENAVGEHYQNTTLQTRDYLHYTATGKAILSALSEDRVAEIIQSHGLPKRTQNTITKEQTLINELDRIREQGFAVNDQEEVEGLRAVGAPILLPDGEVLGAISVSGPVSRMSGRRFDQEVPESVKRVANIIEVDINMNSKIENVQP